MDDAKISTRESIRVSIFEVIKARTWIREWHNMIKRCIAKGLPMQSVLKMK